MRQDHVIHLCIHRGHLYIFSCLNPLIVTYLLKFPLEVAVPRFANVTVTVMLFVNEELLILIVPFLVFVLLKYTPTFGVLLKSYSRFPLARSLPATVTL